MRIRNELRRKIITSFGMTQLWAVGCDVTVEGYIYPDLVEECRISGDMIESVMVDDKDSGPYSTDACDRHVVAWLELSRQP